MLLDRSDGEKTTQGFESQELRHAGDHTDGEEERDLFLENKLVKEKAKFLAELAREQAVDHVSNPRDGFVTNEAGMGDQNRYEAEDF